MLLDAARGADDDVRTVLQGGDLRAQRHAATQRQDLNVVFGTGQATQFLGHLVGELARGAQHQRLAAEVPRVDRVEQADTKGGGLAAPGLGLGDQVLALENDRQALGLDRRHRGVAEGVQVGQHGGGQR